MELGKLVALRAKRDAAQVELNEARGRYDECYLGRLHFVANSSNAETAAAAEAASASGNKEEDCERQYEAFKKSFEAMQMLDDEMLKAESEERISANLQQDRNNSINAGMKQPQQGSQ